MYNDNPVVFYVEEEGVIGTWGQKGQGETFEELIVLFMTTDETLISYNEGDSNLQIDSGKLAAVDLGAAIQEFRDTNIDVQGIVTTPEKVTQYLHGVELYEY